ncbi:MAG: hypothetical protein JXB04_12635, partial [Kiritimatiellae bacterium]|nr:hypothetical protein [Kiritimatiellia bacterium]
MRAMLFLRGLLNRFTILPSIGKSAPDFSKHWKILIVCALAVAVPLAADAAEHPPGLGQEPMPTRWTGAQPRPMPATCPFQPFSLREAGGTEPAGRGALSFEPGHPATGRIAIVVYSNLFSSAVVSNALDLYAADLSQHGFSTVTLSFSGSAEELRGALSNYYDSAQSLKGALLVGDLPYAVWEMYKQFDEDPAPTYEAEIADIFFMDLDGTWADTNSAAPFEAGRYDTRSGDLYLEIWVSRVRAGGMSLIPGYAEEALTSNYFQRVHDYRLTNTLVAKRALHFTDYDWTNWAEPDAAELTAAYGSVTSRSCSVADGIGGAEFRDRWLTNDL